MLKYVSISLLLFLSGCTIKKGNVQAPSNPLEASCIAEIQKQASQEAEIERISESSVKMGNNSTYTGNFTVTSEGKSQRATCKIETQNDKQNLQVTFE